MKLPRTIRLDGSDAVVFERAAAPDEWAVSGAFMFAESDLERLTGKARVAFRSGLLGIASFGWSTLVVVAPASAADRAAAVETLARNFVDRLGAPSLEAARAVAEDEIAFAASLCDHPLQTLLAVHRTIEDGAMREAFRTLKPRPGAVGQTYLSDRVFTAIEEGDAEATVDLTGLTHRRQS